MGRTATNSEQIARYLAGRLSASETREFEALYSGQPVRSLVTDFLVESNTAACLSPPYFLGACNVLGFCSRRR